VHQVGSVLR